jgi:hypothetical protein
MEQNLYALVLTVSLCLLATVSQSQMPITLSVQPKLWLTAEKGLVFSESGKTVASWSDALNPTIVFTQKSESLQPQLVEKAVEGQPALLFGGKKGQFLEGLLTSPQYLTAKSTIFWVSKVGDATNGGFQCGTMGITGNYALRGNGCVGVSTNYPFGLVGIFTGQYHTDDCVYSSAFLNGLPLPSNAQGCPVGPGAKMVIGSVGKGKNVLPYQGLVCELLVYNEILSPAARILVENYLGSKYGVNVHKDLFLRHDPSYRFRVAGIGLESEGGVYRAESGGLLLIAPERNGPLNSNGDYVLIGHNAPEDDWKLVDENAWIANPQASGAGTQRLRREWFLDKTGQLGDGLTLLFARERIGVPEATLEGGNFVLLYRRSLKDSFVPIESKCFAGDKGPQFSLTNAQLEDGYYTLGKL